MVENEILDDINSVVTKIEFRLAMENKVSADKAKSPRGDINQRLSIHLSALKDIAMDLKIIATELSGPSVKM
jgi:hypothetical protein